ncbi:MAG: hypothetical protein HY321_11450 [Armatimonadetes bacterium]|nr:hypothetical protein [Armatimonadota bacterium]
MGANIGLKTVGGIRSAEFALELLNAGASRPGTASGVRILEEREAAMERKEPAGARRK